MRALGNVLAKLRGLRPASIMKQPEKTLALLLAKLWPSDFALCVGDVENSTRVWNCMRDHEWICDIICQKIRTDNQYVLNAISVIVHRWPNVSFKISNPCDAPWAC
jgi:hypothetical protein